MKVWNREIRIWNMSYLLIAVKCDRWQKFRLSLKGVRTEEKLDRLNDYLENLVKAGNISDWEYCRVDNYINALLRGGQLVHRNNQVVVQR